ncbi:MAG: C4-type zinc ribbon domain-containing protein [Acidimicrobiia bacterium]|nr:C4-type zinc ribbon domain-containing protein [Acidimicrobiia bacterium]
MLALVEQIEPVDAELEQLVAGSERGRETGARGAGTQRSPSRKRRSTSRWTRSRPSVSAPVEGVSPAHLEEYEKLRRQLGGIGVAPLEGGTCGGCNLTLSAVERDRIKSEPPDAVIHCEECGRLLVRR